MQLKHSIRVFRFAIEYKEVWAYQQRLLLPWVSPREGWIRVQT